MKEFWQVLVKYVKPYNGYLGGAVVLNILSAVLNIFSFSLIIPILQILFKMDTTVYTFIPWDSTDASFKEIVINNAYYGVTMLIQDKGASVTLLLMCLWLGIMTFFKTSCYFGASAIMIPIRTSVVRDMRRELYNKILTLPLGFFSQERKGDIIARMSGDIGEVDNEHIGHAPQEPDSHHLLYRHIDNHKLAAHHFHGSRGTASDLAYERARQNIEKTLTPGTGTVERHHVPA